MRFVIREHQGKEKPYRAALKAAGHVETQPPAVTDVMLIDYDGPHPAYASWVRAAREHNFTLCIYPHGFTTTMVHDLLLEPVEVAATFVSGEGQRQLMETYGYPHPIHVVGWPGPRNIPEPRELSKILFAPHHPLGDGGMSDEAREGNAAAFRLLLEEDAELIVRYVGSMRDNGLWAEKGVRYVQGVMGDGTVHAGDVVVAGGTYAADCLALGVPVVMYDQDQEWRFHSEADDLTGYPEGWEGWREFTRYPYDLDRGVCVVAAADPNPPEVREWKDRFLGECFDHERFVAAVERAALVSA